MDKIEASNKLSAIDISDPAWYQATTLSERARLLLASGDGGPPSFDADRAERRLERWLSEPPFEEDRSRFSERLAADGISEDDLRVFLGEPTEATRDRFEEPPRWPQQLARAFSDSASETVLSPIELPTGEGPSGSETLGFLNAVEPLLSDGRERLHQGIEEMLEGHTYAPFTPSGVEKLLFPNLPGKLLSKLSRTMILELNVARVEGMLEGETPEERFQNFIEHLQNKDEALEILREYPVLARQLVICVDQWVETGVELARHLCEDWRYIKDAFFGGEDPGELTGLEGGAGDQHRGGRSVHIVTFASGLKLVYKPRSLAVDRHFQELLSWLNERGSHPPFRVLETLDRGTHGWVEYVEAHGCSSQEEIKRFYRRQGGYLALLYAVHATDFHYENLIAAGEHPVLVDLESLFHPSSRGPDDTGATSLARATLNESVLVIGLLPRRVWGGEEQKEGIDISGLGSSEGQTTPYRLPYWEASATDEMKLARKKMEMPGSNNRPTLGETELDVLDYQEDIVTGFTEVYRLLIRNREELVSGDGPLSQFASDETRYIARPTRTYMMRLQESFHPDLLRDALDRDRFFDRLWVSGQEESGAARADPNLTRLFPHEREDLQRGDIPAFTTLPDSRDLWSTSGERIPNYLDKAPLEVAHRRIGGLDEQDLARQTWIIRASFTALTLGEGRARWPIHKPPEPENEASREGLLSAAQKVGDRLGSLALHAGEQVNWMGLELVRERVWTLAPLSSNLYNGLPGIALFLGYLGYVTEQRSYTELAERTVATIHHQFEQVRGLMDSLSQSSDKPQPSIGAFGEVGGAIYALTHLGVLWDRPELLDEAERLAELLRPLISTDENLDMISGVSGCASVLLGLHALRPEGSALEIAHECGEHLLSHVHPAEQGLNWSSSFGQKPLAGFSHGAAGMAQALLELSSVTGERRFRDTALEVIIYERSHFSPEHGNWPDLRDPEILGLQNTDEKNFMTAWCHGAPGIGLSRLRAMEYVDDPELGEEVETAIGTTLKEGFGMNHSLCHGALGNLELLLEAARTYGDTELLSLTYRTADSILRSISKHGWLCGVPSGVETPGLMTGISGIGYGLLRIGEPEKVPSVLSLGPPISYSGELSTRCG